MTPQEFEARRNFEVYSDEAAFAALERRLNTQMSAVLVRFPELAEAVPPVPLERVSGTFAANVSEVWGDLTDRWRSGAYRLPIASSLDGLTGPFRGFGYCLEPIRAGESFDYYDTRAAAQDGDFVLVQWYPPVLQAMIERNRHKPEWTASYGEQPGPLATKLLKRFANEYWLLTNGSMLPLGNNRIVGVLRHTESCLSAHDIADEAITTIASAEDASGSLLNGGGVVLQINALPTIGLDYTLVVTASLNVWITDFGSVFQTPVFHLNIDTIVSSQSAEVSATVSPGERIALQCEVDISASDEPVSVSISWSGAQPDGTAEYRSASIRCEAIKR